MANAVVKLFFVLFVRSFVGPLEQVQFNKTRQNEEEEGKLREELKSIDQQIKKLRQSSKSSSKQGDEIQALADARR